MTTPQFKQLRQSYGFDEVAIVPGDVTINPDQTKIILLLLIICVWILNF